MKLCYRLCVLHA
uniref:Uncharacterized protein n=1 Tax=Anopheles quadriannulatus TaxID=34691 RepID=A0A182XQT2_ANOQN